MIANKIFNFLKFRLIEPKRSVPEATHELHVENGATCKNQPFTEGKEGKLGLPFNYAVFIVLSHLYTNICSRRVL